MHKVFILFLTGCLSVQMQLSAQTAEELYPQSDTIADTADSLKKGNFYTGFGLTVPLSGEVTMGYTNLRGWGGSFSLNVVSVTSADMPLNYDGGNSLFGQGSDKIEKDKIVILAVRAVKLFPDQSAKSIWGVEIGPSLVKATIAENFKRVANPCQTDPFWGAQWCKPNYTYQRNTYSVPGISLKCSVKLVLSELLGLEFGVESNINRKLPFYGVDMVFLLGDFKRVVMH